MSFLKNNDNKKCHVDDKNELIFISKLFWGLKTAKLAAESLNFQDLCNNFSNVVSPSFKR